MDDNSKGMLITSILNGVIWITGGIVSATAIKKTGNGKWGYLMLIPVFGSFSYHHENKPKDSK